MKSILLQNLLFLSLILSSGAFTTNFDGRAASTGVLRRNNNERPLRQHSARADVCPSIPHAPRRTTLNAGTESSPFDRRISHSSPPSSILLSATSSEDEESSIEEEDDGGDKAAEVVEEASDAAVGVEVDPTWKRVLFFYKYNKDGSLKPVEDDGLTFKQKLAKAGLSVLLSYGFVSNMSYCVTVSLAWFGFTKKTGLSPLAPGQWKGFLAVYAGFYVFNNFVRPMRFAASVGVAPYFEKVVNAIQRKTKLNRGISIGIVVFLANVCGTTSLMSLGIYIASLASGIPVFPPKA